jgi:hypothetical protein
MRLIQVWLAMLIALSIDPSQAEAVFRDTLFMGSAAVMYRFSLSITALAPLTLIGVRELIFRGVLAWMVQMMGGE